MFYLLLFLLSYFLSWLFEKTTKRWAMWDKKIGWQIHHSIFGLLALILIPIFPIYIWELAAIGLGIIAQHTRSDGFVFLKKG